MSLTDNEQKAADLINRITEHIDKDHKAKNTINPIHFLMSMTRANVCDKCVKLFGEWGDLKPNE